MSQTSLYKNGRDKCRLQGAYHLSPQEGNGGKKANALKCLDTFLHLFGLFKAQPFTHHKTQDLAILLLGVGQETPGSQTVETPLTPSALTPVTSSEPDLTKLLLHHRTINPLTTTLIVAISGFQSV